MDISLPSVKNYLISGRALGSVNALASMFVGHSFKKKVDDI